VNDVGKPCAREAHARFDGRGLETEPSQATAPVPDPTQASLFAVISRKEWLIRWSIPCLAIKGQDSVYAAQEVGIRLAIRKNIQKFVSSDQYYLVPLVRLQVNHCGFK
jgi:hypothetical protein